MLAFHRASIRQHPVLTAEDTPHPSLSKSLHSNPLFKQRKGTRADEQPTNATPQQQGTRTWSVAAFTERLDTDTSQKQKKNRRAHDDLPQDKLPAMTTSETTHWPHRSMNSWSWQHRERTQNSSLRPVSLKNEHVPRHVSPRLLVRLCSCVPVGPCVCALSGGGRGSQIRSVRRRLHSSRNRRQRQGRIHAVSGGSHLRV